MKAYYGKETVLFGDSLTDTACWMENNKRLWSYNESESAPQQDWDLGVSWNKALEMSKTGWSEGAQLLHGKLQAIPPATYTLPNKKWGIAGHYPSVSRYLSGDPRNMLAIGKRQGNPPIIHLVINCIASASVSAQEYMNYGAAIVSMIEQLEATKRRVELDVVFVDQLSHTRAILGWKVKKPGDYCDLAAIAFSVAHPAAFRKLGFALIERTNKSNECYSYGRCAKITPDDAKHINADGAFLLDGVGERYGACRTLEGALKLAAEQINRAAGEELVTLA